MHTCLHTTVCTCLQTCECTCLHTCVHTYVHTHVCAYVQTHVYSHAHAHVYTHVHTHVCTHVDTLPYWMPEQYGMSFAVRTPPAFIQYWYARYGPVAYIVMAYIVSSAPQCEMTVVPRSSDSYGLYSHGPYSYGS